MRIDAETVEMLAANDPRVPVAKMEQELVQLARRGGLRGVVTKPPRYSASTIQNFEDCERLFYWPTLAGLEAPPSPAQRFGIGVHSQLERYLKKGVLPDRASPEGILASVALPLIPTSTRPGLYSEEQFSLALDDLPVVITGTRDFGVDPQEKGAEGFLLGDFKTARSMRWPKTKAWLSGNIQSNIYAYAKWSDLHAAGFGALRVVDKQWVYLYKDERQAEKLRVVQDLGEVSDAMDGRIKPLVRRMHALVEGAPKISDVPLPNDRSVCERYGGCPHRARCFGMGLQGENMGALSGKFSKAAIVSRVQGAGAALNPPKAPPMKAAPPPPEPEETAPPQEEAPPPPKAAKGKKAKAEPREEAQAPRAASGKALTAPGGNSAHDFWLFVGCAPAKGFDAPQLFVEEIVGAAQANAAVRLGTDHYRAGKESYGVLETCFAEWLEENALVGAVIVDPNTIVARDVIGLLRAHATAVVERRM